MLYTICRVEHNETGIGPYHGQKIWKYEHHNNDSINHPLPEVDNIVKDHFELFYGFKSLIQLYQWFSIDDIKALMPLGFITAYYQIDSSKIVFGNKQLGFYRDDIKPYKKEPLM